MNTLLDTARGNTTVATILTNLNLGELAQYAVSEPTDANLPRLMAALNRGVNQLQADLSIHEDSVQLELIEGVHTYHIHSDHSQITGTADHKYIWDSEYKPFTDNILRIQQVLNSEGTEFPINMRNNIDTIYTPSHNTIQFPYAVTGQLVSVVYTSYTEPTEVSSMEEAETKYLPVPDYVLPALYAYVASLMTAGMTTQQEISESQSWRNAYELEVSKLKNTPANTPNGYWETKLHDRGFV